jgi:hypothetical protein
MLRHTGLVPISNLAVGSPGSWMVVLCPCTYRPASGAAGSRSPSHAAVPGKPYALSERKIPCQSRSFSHIQHTGDTIEPKITGLILLLPIAKNHPHDKICSPPEWRHKQGTPGRHRHEFHGLYLIDLCYPAQCHSGVGTTQAMLFKLCHVLEGDLPQKVLVYPTLRLLRRKPASEEVRPGQYV